MRLPRIKDYPKSILVRDEEYRISFVKVIKGDPTTLGQCCSSECKIWIKKGQGPAETLKTFVHEVLHALEFEYKIKIKHRSVYRLEVAIFELLLANF